MKNNRREKEEHLEGLWEMQEKTQDLICDLERSMSDDYEACLLEELALEGLVDLNVDSLTEDDLTWADMVFVGGMTIQRKSAREVISRCRAGGLRIVAGGPLFTAEHEAFEEVDHFVLGEAELTLPPFLQDLADGLLRCQFSFLPLVNDRFQWIGTHVLYLSVHDIV